MAKQEIKIKESSPIEGRVVVREHKAGAIETFMRFLLTPSQEKFIANKEIQLGEEFVLENYLTAEQRLEVNDYIIKTGKVVSDNHNLIQTAPNLGRDLLVQYLMGNLATGAINQAYNTGINWGAIGTSNTTPTGTDTLLGAETNRSSVLFAQDQGYNIASLQFFYPDGSIVNQTYYEFGSFINGTSSLNSGQMFNHALFSSPYVKTSGSDLTVQISITFS